MEFFLESLPQCLINGLTRGSIYALIAIGFTIIYNSTDIINFAQGEFAMLGALLAISLTGALGLPLWLAVPAAVGITMVIAALLESLAIRPPPSLSRGFVWLLERLGLSRQGAGEMPSVINLIIITIGASIFFKGVAMLLWGKDDLALPAFSGTQTIHLGPAALTPQSLWVWGATLIAVVLLHLFYSRTITGKALRACAHNPVASSLMGINVQRMVLITFALSGGLGALAGVIITPIIFANYQMGGLIGLKGFCAAILGGMGSMWGAVLGGLLIGILESLFGTHLSSGYMDAFAFVVMLIVLFLRPRGLLGEAGGERA